METSHQKDQAMIRSLTFQHHLPYTHLPHSPGRGEGLEMELMIIHA